MERPAWELFTGRPGEKEHSSPRVTSREMTQGNCCDVGNEEYAARPRGTVANRPGMLRVKRPACYSMAYRRMLKLRLSYSVAVPQT